MRVAQAAAAFDGRDYLLPDDVKRAVQPVLRHRVILKPEAELEGFDAEPHPRRRNCRRAGAPAMILPSLHPTPVSAACERRQRWSFALTPRSIGLLLVGFVWLVPGFWDGRLAYAMPAWDALVLLFALLDSLRLPTPAELTASRSWSNAPAPRQRDRNRADD